MLGERCLDDPTRLGELLRQHPLTKAVLDVARRRGRARSTRSSTCCPARTPPAGAARCRPAPEITAEGARPLRRAAVHGAEPGQRRGRPLLNIETHLWVRAVSRLLRGTSPPARFGWYGEAPREPDPYAPTPDLVVADNRYPRLPAVYCRHCGRSGWTALSPEKDPQELETDPDKIYRASVGRDKRRVRALIAATDRRGPAAARRRGLLVAGVRHGGCAPVRPGHATARARPTTPSSCSATCPRRSTRRARRTAARPASMDHGIRFLGAGLATLASVAITQLFTGGELDEAESARRCCSTTRCRTPRTGPVSSPTGRTRSRCAPCSPTSWTPGTAVALERPDRRRGRGGDATRQILAAVVPPDLHDQPGVDAPARRRAHAAAGETWDADRRAARVRDA